MRIRLRSRGTAARNEIRSSQELTSVGEPSAPQGGVTHREFLKMCGLGALGGGVAILAAGAGQLAVPATPAAAQTYNEDLLVNSPYNLYVGGKVGIGIVTTPAESLEIVGGNIKLSTANSSLLLYSSGAGGIVINDNATANSGYGQINRSDGALALATSKIGTGTAGPITFRPNNVEAMRIDAAGNVGIGSAASGYKLYVNGIAFVQVTLYTTDIRSGGDILNLNYNSAQGVFLFGQTSGNPPLRLYGKESGVTSPRNVDMYVNSAGNFTVTPNPDKHVFINIGGTGGVGIGRSTPAGKLDVGGDIFVNGTAAIGSDGVAKQCYYAQ
ncbi:MAG: hypothetical protein EPO21_23570 [Chloroflexota bacterium]|nr:MAG: hypothetical protein EPO21_23570 [Chloroflexota bacterium]